MDHANSINGRKILYKKNFFDIQMQGNIAGDNEKLNPNMHNPQLISTHFDLNDILFRKKLEPIKLKITN
jgi:hypothetical protein